jgi:hypothetical protein
VDLIVKLLLKSVVGWIQAHPNSACSRFMLKEHGPRTDVARMNRVQRLASFSQDNLLVQFLIFGLALLAGCGFIGGLYLLLRVVF